VNRASPRQPIDVSVVERGKEGFKVSAKVQRAPNGQWSVGLAAFAGALIPALVNVSPVAAAAGHVDFRSCTTFEHFEPCNPPTGIVNGVIR
jgi:hypothetical protein